jgi:hypothetical protein
MVTSSDAVQNRGIHVVSEAEVTVYGLNQMNATTDAFLGLPTDILGSEYLTLGYQNTNIVNATLFGVVGTQNATTITITPSVTTGVRMAGVPYNINLNQGEVYQLINIASAPADLSGTVVTSNSPVAVFGGHNCANIPPGFTACDHIVEEIPPLSTWGRSFVTFPLATRLRGDTFRFLAGTNSTQISVNGSLVATLNRGQRHEMILTQPSVITSTQPILVAQYSNGSSFDGVTSDPFMLIVPPFEQFLANYTVTTPATVFQINFINIVAPNSAVGSVAIDGVAIPAADYTPIPGTSFSGVARSVTVGSHNLTGPQPFGVSVYGFASFDSYGYPGGLALGQVASVTNIALTPTSATNPVNTQHCVTGRVTDQSSSPLPGIRVDFTVTGANATSGFAFTNASGDAQFCYTGTALGTDTISALVGTVASNTASKIWTSDDRLVCDVDGNDEIDLADIALINAARNTPASGPTDPRDADGDGEINVVDSRFCAIRLGPVIQ